MTRTISGLEPPSQNIRTTPASSPSSFRALNPMGDSGDVGKTDVHDEYRRLDHFHSLMNFLKELKKEFEKTASHIEIVG
ncbi:hypothetical protein AVEN_12154-1 [Araneus ventricosus]|uniref:Uncharacterized protein n=1 Tax=Araneus ventricosus TaxID=182803 RepID=A0A4Y2LP04_ARAVE|nr:hypothetical protein AVEN_12154-1 [Araneus ventricosus]